MKKIFIVLITLAAFAGCKQDNVKLTSLTSFNVTNAVVGGNSLLLNNSENSVSGMGYTQFPLSAGQTVVKLSDTSMHPAEVYYNKTISTANGSYYSLFLTGSSTSQVDNVLIRETYQNYADSVSGVRFINLSPGSAPISVDIAGSANGSEESGVAYLSYTTFKRYSATAAEQAAGYNFEFRDAATGTLITTITLNPPVFKNVTIALTGVETNPSTILINEY